MRILKWSFFVFCCAASTVIAQPATSTNVARPLVPAPGPISPIHRPTIQAPQTKVLAWDSELKESSVSNGVLSAGFVFNVTNVSAADAVITGTHASCQCTVAKLPSEPWVLAPGSNGQIQVSVNLAGKVGTVNKTVTVFLSNQPPQYVTVRVNIAAPPPMSEDERKKNFELAKVDAQAIFKGGCADCHLTPARGRMGQMLFDTMCGVCHEAAPDRRASMVPNLHSLKKPTNYDFWKEVITNGRTNTLMPAFAVAHGGPLTDPQINSLAEFLARNISRNFQHPTAMISTNQPGVPPVGPIPGLKPLPMLKKVNAVVPPTPPVVPAIPPIPAPTNSAAAQ